MDPPCDRSRGPTEAVRFGGGSGPRERERADVARDVADGLVSPEAAERLYGMPLAAHDPKLIHPPPASPAPGTEPACSTDAR